MRSWSRAGIAVALVVIGTLAVVQLNRPGAAPTEPPPTAARTAAPTAAVRLPSGTAIAALPRRPTALPRMLTVDPTRATRLSTDPVRRALALLEVRVDDDRVVHDIVVLGDDGRTRLLDVVTLAAKSDREGNPGSPFRSTALDPTGRFAAFPQRDQVILVDLTRPVGTPIRIPEYCELVAWVGGVLLVGGATTTFQVDPGTGAVTVSPVRVWDVVAGPGPEIVELAADGALRRTGAGGPVRTATVSGLPAISGGFGVYGPTWRRGDLVAATARGDIGEVDYGGQGDVLVAIDVNSAAVRRRLLLTGPDRTFDCCTVLGWLDGQTVLLHVTGVEHTIVAWDTAIGSLALVTRIGPFAVSVRIALATLAG